MLKNLVLFCVLFGLAAEFLHAQITEADEMNGPRDEIKHRRVFGWRKNGKNFGLGRSCPRSNGPCRSTKECLKKCDKPLRCMQPMGKCLLDDKEKEPFF